MPTRETAADIAVAIDSFPWISAIHTLAAPTALHAHPDNLTFAVILSPYGINELVQTHYAVLRATGTHEAAGRVLYVNAAMPQPTPLARAQRVTLSPEERADAERRSAQRKLEAGSSDDDRDAAATQLGDLERAFRQLAENATRDAAHAHVPAGTTPYRDGPEKPINEYNQAELQAFVDRAFAGLTITATFASGATVVEVTRDPFPSTRRRRLLVIDDELETEIALRRLTDVDIVHARDGWTAIDHLSEGSFDLVLCAVVLGDFTGAKLHRIATKARPEMASRMVFLAREHVVAAAPPSSARARILPRPLDPAAVRSLLAALDPP